MNAGRWEYPRMYGDNGWYAFVPFPYAENADELYALSMREDDANTQHRERDSGAE